MRALIVYASHFGQTLAIATTVAGRLRELGATCSVFAVGEAPPPAGYDFVAIGSRIEMGHHSPEIVDYVHAHRDALELVPTAFFSVSMAAATPNAGSDPNGYMETFFERVGWRPSLAIAFAGALPYRRYNWFLRLVMKRISKGAGHPTDTSKNHELTDWNAVRAFGDKIAALVPSQASSARERLDVQG